MPQHQHAEFSITRLVRKSPVVPSPGSPLRSPLQFSLPSMECLFNVTLLPITAEDVNTAEAKLTSILSGIHWTLHAPQMEAWVIAWNLPKKCALKRTSQYLYVEVMSLPFSPGTLYLRIRKLMSNKKTIPLFVWSKIVAVAKYKSTKN